ncbi:DMT family transporter [Clostridium grantii]|uniref:EamA-like transporter family protein n=1 Tax=Clostridium grantii DSM 8605 TaxID=1121316 RepID=A0A1M5WJI6_9CLOT|nr:DMT family transporter [Clostridium grantii]SHH87665.1 EamA-like transporter family protein [Clostridium grantii DSM 8605]
MKNNAYLPYISAATTSLIFGLSFLFSKLALEIVDPITLISFRFLTAFLVMTFLIITKVIKVNYRNKPLRLLFLLALSQPVTYFLFETYGIKLSSSSEAGLMISLIPIVVTLFAAVFLKEKPSLYQGLSILISICGVFIIILMNNVSSETSSFWGTILLFGAVISASVFNILSRKLSYKFTPLELTYFMMFMGALFFNVISIFNHVINNTLDTYFQPLKNINFITSILYLGILSSIIAFFLINFTLSKIEASKSAIFANLSTIVSVFAGVLILKENFYFYHLIGSFLILAGVWGTNFFGRKKIKLT